LLARALWCRPASFDMLWMPNEAPPNGMLSLSKHATFRLYTTAAMLSTQYRAATHNA